MEKVEFSRNLQANPWKPENRVFSEARTPPWRRFPTCKFSCRLFCQTSLSCTNLSENGQNTAEHQPSQKRIFRGFRILVQIDFFGIFRKNSKNPRKPTKTSKPTWNHFKSMHLQNWAIRGKIIFGSKIAIFMGRWLSKPRKPGENFGKRALSENFGLKTDLSAVPGKRTV